MQKTHLRMHFAICLSENPSCFAPSKSSYDTSAACKGEKKLKIKLLEVSCNSRDTNNTIPLYSVTAFCMESYPVNFTNINAVP